MRHLDIHEDRVVIARGRGQEFIDRHPPVHDRIALQAELAEQPLRHHAVHGVVLGEKDALSAEVARRGGHRLFPRDAAAGQRHKEVEKRGLEKRLGDEHIRSRLYGAFSGLIMLVSRDDDDDDVPVEFFPDALCDLYAVHVGYFPVYQADVIGSVLARAAFELGDGGFAVPDAGVAHADAPQHYRYVLALGGLVVHGQNAQFFDPRRHLRVQQGLSLNERKVYDKGRPLSADAFHTNRAVHHADEALHDREAEPAASVFLRDGGALLLKGLEKPRLHLFRDAAAGVGYLDTDKGLVPGSVALADLEPDMPLRREFHGVAEQVHQYLVHAQLIADEPVVHRRQQLRLILQPLLMALREIKAGDAVDHVPEVKGRVGDLHLAGFDRRHVKHVVYHQEQLFGGDLRVGEIALELPRLRPPGQGYEADDRVQRRPHLMRDARKELALGGVRAFSRR